MMSLPTSRVVKALLVDEGVAFKLGGEALGIGNPGYAESSDGKSKASSRRLSCRYRARRRRRIHANRPGPGVQTVTVPPGGATVVDLKIQRAGRYTLVDHALARLERGLAGFLIVDGQRDDEIMHAGPAQK
jgi:hypothetical protein